MDDNSISELKEIGNLFLANGYDFISTSALFAQIGIKGRYYIIDSNELESIIEKVKSEWCPKLLFIMPTDPKKDEICLFSVYDYSKEEIRKILKLKVFL